MTQNTLGGVLTLRASPLCGSVQNAGAFCRTEQFSRLDTPRKQKCPTQRVRHFRLYGAPGTIDP